MEFIKKQIYTNCTGKPVVDQFYIDDDINVPDTKEDVAKIVMGKGKLFVEELQKIENYIRISGKLYYSILYVTDEISPRLEVLDGKLPFEEMIYVEETEEQKYVLQNAEVDFSVSLIHSRKMSLRAMAELEIGKECVQSIAFPIDVDEKNVYKKVKKLQVLTLHTTKKDTYRMKEEVTLPGAKENIGNFLWTDVENRRLDTKLENGKLVIQGEVLVFCLYESPEGRKDWIEQLVPYQGQIDCADAEESMFHHVYASLEDINVDAKMDEDGEVRDIGIEATLQLRISIYKEETLDVLEDLYSVEKECKTECQKVICERLLLQNHSKCKLTEHLSLPELQEDILQICSQSGRLQVEKEVPVEQGILIEGILHLKIFYVKESDEMPFDVWQGMVPFSYLLECEAMKPNAMYDIQHVLEQLSVSLLGGGEVEVKAVLAFHSFIREPIQKEILKEYTMEEFVVDPNEKVPGMVGYLVKEGDEMWDLAKRYHTTTAHIKEINKLETDEIKEGDRILIFKENMSIL